MSDQFTGWLRIPGQPWRPVVAGFLREDAMAGLLRHAERVPGRYKDLIVTAPGQSPDGGVGPENTHTHRRE